MSVFAGAVTQYENEKQAVNKPEIIKDFLQAIDTFNYAFRKTGIYSRIKNKVIDPSTPNTILGWSEFLRSLTNSRYNARLVAKTKAQEDLINQLSNEEQKAIMELVNFIRAIGREMTSFESEQNNSVSTDHNDPTTKPNIPNTPVVPSGSCMQNHYNYDYEMSLKEPKPAEVLQEFQIDIKQFLVDWHQTKQSQKQEAIIKAINGLTDLVFYKYSRFYDRIKHEPIQKPELKSFSNFLSEASYWHIMHQTPHSKEVSIEFINSVETFTDGILREINELLKEIQAKANPEIQITAPEPQITAPAYTSTSTDFLQDPVFHGTTFVAAPTYNELRTGFNSEVLITTAGGTAVVQEKSDEVQEKPVVNPDHDTTCSNGQSISGYLVLCIGVLLFGFGFAFAAIKVVIDKGAQDKAKI